MWMRHLAPAAAILTLAVSACGFSRGAGLARRVERGRPLEDPGPDAYLVWRDDGGWHLRARSDVPRRFHGVVSAGIFARARPVGIAPEALRRDGHVIAFSFVGTGVETGFDWSGWGCPELSLYLDEDDRPLRVFAGAYGASPARMPFDLCP